MSIPTESNIVRMEADHASYFEHFGTFYAPEGLYTVTRNHHLIYVNVDMTDLARDLCALTRKRFPIVHQDGTTRFGPQIQDLVISYLDLDMPIMAKKIANWGRYLDAPNDDMDACESALASRVDDAKNIFAVHYTAGSHYLLDALKECLETSMETKAHILFHDALNQGLWTEDDRKEAEELVKGQHTYTCFNMPFPTYCKLPD